MIFRLQNLIYFLLIFNISVQAQEGKLYRSFFNETISLKYDDANRVIKKRNAVFIDTLTTSIFYNKLNERLVFDDYQLSLIERSCREFKKSKNIEKLWSFHDNQYLSELKDKWIEAQRLEGKPYLFYAHDAKNNPFFHLTDSTVVVCEKGFPITFFIKHIHNQGNTTIFECFNGAKFTLKILDFQTNLAVWRADSKAFENGFIYRMVIPSKNFKDFSMIVNHSAEKKIPDDFLFDELTVERTPSIEKRVTSR